MTTRTCPGCGATHRCADPLYAGKVGNLVAWTDDGIVRVVGDWLFLQNLGTLRLLEPAR